MLRVNSRTAVNGQFVDGDPVYGPAPTTCPAAWLNAVQEELCSVIEGAGLTLAAGDNTQLRQAIAASLARATTAQAIEAVSTSLAMTPQGTLAQLLSNPVGLIAGGTADALTGALPKAPQTGLADRMTVLVRATASNASATPTFRLTLGTTDTGAVGIVGPGGAALAAGAIAGAGHWLLLTYDATLAKWVLGNPASTASAVALLGAARGLVVSANGTSASVSIAADELVVKDSSGVPRLLTGVSLSASTAATGINGLDAGVIAANTWYAVYVVVKADGTRGALLSLSATAPTLPSGYVYAVRVGWIRTDGTANKYPRAFRQVGRRAQWIVGAGTNVTALPSLASGTAGDITTPTYVAVSVSGAVPPSAVAISVGLFNNTALGCAMVAPNPAYGAYITTASPPPITQYPASAAGEAVSISSLVLESTNIYWASNAPATNLFCIGWEDA